MLVKHLSNEKYAPEKSYFLIKCPIVWMFNVHAQRPYTKIIIASNAFLGKFENTFEEERVEWKTLNSISRKHHIIWLFSDAKTRTQKNKHINKCVCRTYLMSNRSIYIEHSSLSLVVHGGAHDPCICTHRRRSLWCERGMKWNIVSDVWYCNL